MAKSSLSADELRAIKNEVKMALKINEEELQPRIQESMERYMGTFVPAMAVDWSILLNEFYPVVQFQLPAIFFRNPKVFLKPRNKFFIAKRRDPVTGKMVDQQLDSSKSARTQEAILNYQLGEIKYKQEVRKVLQDGLMFPHGVLWHGYKGEFGMTEEASIIIRNEAVFVRRIPPLDFLYDPSVTIENLNEARWIGRRFWVRKQDLIDDDKLNVDKKVLQGEIGFSQKVGAASSEDHFNRQGADTKTLGPKVMPLIDTVDKEFKNSDLAKFIRVYEVLMRPTKKQKRNGEKGKIVLLTFEQVDLLREDPWPYKAEGWPSKVLQFNPVPDSMFGLSDFDSYKGEADHKNLVINQQIRNAEQTNRVLVGISKEGADEETIEKVVQGQNSIVQFDSGDVRQRMFVANMGGAASQELYLLDGRINRSLEEKSGVSDLRKGFLQSGEESAASAKIRAAGGSARPAYRQDLMADFLKDSVEYLNDLLKQYMPVTEAVRIVGSLDIEWSDNPSKQEIQADVDVDIDVTSMAPENPDKEIQELTTILNLMVQALTSPDIRQKVLQEGKMFNLSPIIENLLLRLKIRDPEVFRGVRPEESEGFILVRDVREAKANVEASIQGQPPPFPPAPGQDHVARLEIYTAINSLLQAMGQEADILAQLVQVQTALLQEEQERNNPKAGQRVNLKQPSITTPQSPNGAGR